MTPQSSPVVRDVPPDGGWLSIRQNPSHEAERSRDVLGIPTDRAVVMTGHQAEWWHPGIVAKFIGADRLAHATGSSWAWLVTDQDATDPWGYDEPRVGDEIVSRVEVRLHDPPEGGVVAKALPAIEASASSGEIARAMQRHASAKDGVEQWSLAMRDLLKPRMALPGPVRATALVDIPSVTALIERMIEDPLACAKSYNRAIRSVPDAGLAALHVGVDPGAVELPLWWIKDDGTRGRVFAGDTERIDRDRLAPRALLLTGIARWLLCDLFVHGVGGYIYDRATDAWFADWLGVSLAPMGSITADMLLPLRASQVTDQELRQSLQRAHKARHSPELLSDAEAQSQKTKYLRIIETLDRGSLGRKAAYHDMHRVLDRYRHKHADELALRREKAAHMRAAYEAQGIARSRTWAFALHSDASQDALVREVERVLGV